MARYQCSVCGFIYDEEKDGARWDDLADAWPCPVCGVGKELFESVAEPADSAPAPEAHGEGLENYLSEWRRRGDSVESAMDSIHEVAVSGESIVEPMRTRRPTISWEEILVKGAQLARIPLNAGEPVCSRTVIGPGAEHPLILDTPVYVTHMSFGALSREVKIAMAMGSAAVGTAMCSGEGGILPEEFEAAHRYIFEIVPNRYSLTEENLQRVHAVEIKIGQAVKPGMGGHLPGDKVTEEISAVRGFPPGKDIHSPARFDDVSDEHELKEKVDWLREASGGKPVGIKLAAGRIEEDLEIALFAGPDFVTLDGRGGSTGAALKSGKDSTSVPTVFALHRARKFLDEKGAEKVSLVITGGLRTSADFAKALAMGADAVAIGTAAMIACGCQQYRICHTGRCPVGIATQDPKLRKRLDIEKSAKRLENYLRVSTEELKGFARLTGNDDVHKLGVRDLCTASSEISAHTEIEHV